MKLSKDQLTFIGKTTTLDVPAEEIFGLPEKVLQFGTGVLLRGLPDYFIDKANKQGIFNGRIVVVKSTEKGDSSSFDVQNGLYTIGIRGVEASKVIKKNIISAAISRVLTVQSDWEKILEVAASKELSIVISNTTETGIRYVEERISNTAPLSFPGKLLAVLYHRFKELNGAIDKGLVILPTELITENGTLLKQTVLKLADFNGFGEDFYNWVDNNNSFCNTLVDRIVPGKPGPEALNSVQNELGYTDELLIFAEVYRLWAIEGDDAIKRVISFEQADAGVIVTPDITVYKELKLRLLNGTHTLCCAIAILSGFETVREATDDIEFSAFMSSLMEDELARAVPFPVELATTLQFSATVIDRFKNPHIEHKWEGISVNYTTKMRLRVIDVLLRYYANFSAVPENISLGFAAYIVLMKGDHQVRNSFFEVDDEQFGYFKALWRDFSAKEVVRQVLSNSVFWGTDLSILPGFTDAVERYINAIQNTGINKAMQSVELNQH